MIVDGKKQFLKQFYLKFKKAVLLSFTVQYLVIFCRDQRKKIMQNFVLENFVKYL